MRNNQFKLFQNPINNTSHASLKVTTCVLFTFGFGWNVNKVQWKKRLNYHFSKHSFNWEDGDVFKICMVFFKMMNKLKSFGWKANEQYYLCLLHHYFKLLNIFVFMMIGICTWMFWFVINICACSMYQSIHQF
jgi:hypothetical protein